VSSERLRAKLEELTVKQLEEIAKEFDIKLRSSDKRRKEKMIERIMQGLPKEKVEEFAIKIDEMLKEAGGRGRRRAARAAGGPATVEPIKPAATLDDVFRELSEIRKILLSLDERLPARVPSFREFARAVLEEYWRLGGGFVSLDRLREAVCSRLLIPPQAFDVWFRDLLWAAAGRLSLHESRTEKGLSVHILTTAKTPEELVWGG
jgi:DNA-binding protein H-NS